LGCGLDAVGQLLHREPALGGRLAELLDDCVALGV
jgi:hypothetical protein